LFTKSSASVEIANSDGPVQDAFGNLALKTPRKVTYEQPTYTPDELGDLVIELEGDREGDRRLVISQYRRAA